MCAARLNSAGGSNLRCSCRMESILVDCASTTLSAMCNLGYGSRNRARDSEKHSTHERDLLSAHSSENRPNKLLMSRYSRKRGRAAEPIEHALREFLRRHGDRPAVIRAWNFPQ